MRRSLLAPAIAVALFLVACGERPDRSPTYPAAEPAVPRLSVLSAACGRSDAQYLQQNTDALFSTRELRAEARTKKAVVDRRCDSSTPKAYPGANATETLASAPAAAVDYTAWLLEQRAKKNVAVTDAVLWEYVGRLFSYVGYSAPSSSLTLSTRGFAAVCRAGTACVVEAPDGRSGISLPAAALGTQTGVGYLVTGTPITCAAFGTTASYTIYGECMDITVDPKPGTTFVLNGSGTVVELCARQQPATPSYIYTRRLDVYTGTTTTQGKLAQRSEESSGGYTPISFRPYAAGFLNDKWCTETKVAQGGMAAPLRWLGSALASAVLPARAHASHGGLGTLPGSTSQLSVFGPLDGYAFYGRFDSDQIGAFPSSPAELRGTWSLAGPDPSAATVQYGTGLFGSNYLQLNQAGGNAPNKAPMVFTGWLATPMVTAPEDEIRTIRIRWRAAVMSARAFDATFTLLTDSVSVTEGGVTVKKQPLELARVVYKDGASAQGGTIVFVAPDGTLLTGSPTWTTGTIRDFEVTIKLTRATGVASVSVGFVNQTPLKTYTVNASSFGGIAWTLPGRDGQIIASDEYQVFDVTDDIL